MSWYEGADWNAAGSTLAGEIEGQRVWDVLNSRRPTEEVV